MCSWGSSCFLSARHPGKAVGIDLQSCKASRALWRSRCRSGISDLSNYEHRRQRRASDEPVTCAVVEQQACCGHYVHALIRFIAKQILLGASALMCCSCMDPGAGHLQQAFGFRAAHGTNDRVAMVPTPVLLLIEEIPHHF